MPDINMQHFGELQRNQHSIDVEIDASLIASPQQDFPMMLETPNSSNSALNIVAINELGEQLPTEIEGVVNNKNWVHLKDLVQSIVNHKIKIFYGGSGGKLAVDSTYGSEAVWDANYVAVWHMNNDPASSNLLDSTLNDNDGVSGAGLNSSNLVNSDTGYGKGINFEGTSTDLFTVPHHASLNLNQHTVEAIATQEANPEQYPGLVQKGSNYLLYKRKDSLSPDGMAYTVGGNSAIDTVGMTLGTPFYWVGRYDGSNVELYMDAGLRDDTAYSGTPSTNTDDLIIGIYPAAGYWDGIISEIRISNVARSSNYISTTHKNLNNPTASGNSPFYKSISKELNFAESLQSLGRAG